jgi:hypothetical protein
MPADHHHEMTRESPLGLSATREGSGTSWLPDESTTSGFMRHEGQWMLMLHGTAFVQFLHAGSPRGDDQFGSTNWVMGMAQRSVGTGQFTVRGMLSADPLTVGRCGYPILLQTGEFCRERQLHDRQHPHDVFMELAVDYRRPLSESVALEVYGGAAGEPALGPTAYPHRLSAMANPLAPIAHHWLDATHISFGVVTGAIYGRAWKAEGSVFNGREPDDARYNIDFDALDSYSGRLWWLPGPRWALQVSAGHLNDAEPAGAPAGPRRDVNRVTASVTYHRIVNHRVWATTVAYGVNREEDHATRALTAETSLDLTRKQTLFARGEIVGKSAEDLVIDDLGHEPITVGKLQVGYARWLGTGAGMRAGIGGTIGLALMPESLATAYDGRTAGEFGVFLALRPR